LEKRSIYSSKRENIFHPNEKTTSIYPPLLPKSPLLFFNDQPFLPLPPYLKTPLLIPKIIKNLSNLNETKK